ncbi:hypothetical protein NAPIS_ORF01099 [Vairimorpha apis BRL 01]|uniref:Uncharacterized protein n=1 Tax=Vairimorpha apis BRL 01 TaxID=1037528 RepID=T0MDJ1_9MICR|nr:hypothetical protein NAPIS_ORF01099 [Vairimorpha apis BRL 01]
MLLHVLYILTYNKNRCLPENGSYILNVKFHIDIDTSNKILLLEKYTPEKSERATIKNFLNKILNDVNKEYVQYGVQFIGDYSILLFEELNTSIQKTDTCKLKFIALNVNTSLMFELANLQEEGVGLRIVVLSCFVYPFEQLPFFSNPVSLCGRLSTIFSIEPLSLSTTIYFMIKKFVDDMNIRFSCNIIRKCCANNSHFGKFIQELDSVEHSIQKF